MNTALEQANKIEQLVKLVRVGLVYGQPPCPKLAEALRLIAEVGRSHMNR